jgi:thermitase
MQLKKAIQAVLIGSSSVLLLGIAEPGAILTRSTAAIATTFKNWGLMNTQAKSHINALDAWKLEEKSPSQSVIVAVIDTGIDPSHKDLAKNIWHKDGAVQNFGWNYVTGKANPMDEHGHGTHVAGIIGAVVNPKSGVGGVTQNVQIMAVKYYSDSNPGSVNLKNTISAIHYAIDNGAKIINYSGGGPEFSEEEYLAIKRAESKGILFVAAAGNEHQNTDQIENYYYPSAYRLSNIISVAATDIRNNLLPSSNWGRTQVHVAAPGENIYSTLPGDKYGYMSGTSQATAFVTGIAALLLSKNPSLTPTQIRELIMKSVDPIPGLSGKLAAGGRVNAYQALVALKNGVGASSGTSHVSAPDTLARHPVSLDAMMRPVEPSFAPAGVQ